MPARYARPDSRLSTAVRWELSEPDPRTENPVRSGRRQAVEFSCIGSANPYNASLMADEATKPMKYAVVENGGGQLYVEEGDVFTVNRLPGEAGSKVELGNVLLVNDNGAIKIGQPVVAGAKVTATIVAHELGKKVLVFKFKKTKNYRRKRGHRQELSRIKIDSITC